MAEREPSNSLRDLDARLKRLRAEEHDDDRAESLARERGRGLSLAIRIGVELVAALAVGVGIGYLLDRWLGTTPWLLVLFFLLGAAAGMLNVYRVMSGMTQGVGYAAERKKAEAKGGDERDAVGEVDDRGQR